MGVFDKLKEIAKAAVKTGETVGTFAYRKARKPFRQYMASERAEKVLEKQRKVPRRAPMNVPKIQFPKEKLEENKAKVKEILQKSDELVKNIDKMKIVSHELPDVTDKKKSSQPMPQARGLQPLSTQETPRGLIPLRDIIELLHNVETYRDDWTTEELAERFRLRESDVKDLIDNFKLVQPEDRVIKHLGQ